MARGTDRPMIDLKADSKFSINLLFAASKCHVIIQRQWQFNMFKMAERQAERSDGCSGQTLLAPCTRTEEEAAEKDD